MSRRFVVILWLLSLTGPIAGCLLPVYRMPGGFSSSYRRHLYGPAGVAIDPVPPQSSAGKAQAKGVFFPSTVRFNSDTARGTSTKPPERPGLIETPGSAAESSAKQK